MAQERRPRVLVVGGGGIGGVVSAGLNQSASTLAEVATLSVNPAIAREVSERGFRIREGSDTAVVRGRMETALATEEPAFDWILLATQPPQVEAAARSVLPWLAPSGAMVCFQNGLCEARIARIAGADRVVGAVVAWGASMPEPGIYERTSEGGFTIGRIDGVDDPRLPQLALLLEVIGPVTVTRNLAGARWSKLAINCAISTLGTLGGMRLGSLMIHRFARRLALEIMTEVVEVARAEQVHLEKVAGTIDLDWIALSQGERMSRGSPSLFAKHSMLLAVGARYRRLRSSMLAAIERGKPPAVDFLNGEVADHGARMGVATPVNAEAQALVHAVARGVRKPSLKLVHRLAAFARIAAARRAGNPPKRS